MKDAESMTLESFFLADYQRMRQENDELRQEIAEQRRESSKQYGVFDLNGPVEMVIVKTAPYYYYTGDYALKDYTADEIEDIHDKTSDELLKWAKSFDFGPYMSRPIEITEQRYRFSIEVADMDGVKRYAFDPRYCDPLVPIDDSEPNMVDNLGRWMPSGMLDDLTAAACGLVRSNLLDAYEEKRKAKRITPSNRA